VLTIFSLMTLPSSSTVWPSLCKKGKDGSRKVIPGMWHSSKPRCSCQLSQHPQALLSKDLHHPYNGGRTGSCPHPRFLPAHCRTAIRSTVEPQRCWQKKPSIQCCLPQSSASSVSCQRTGLQPAPAASKERHTCKHACTRREQAPHTEALRPCFLLTLKKWSLQFPDNSDKSQTSDIFAVITQPLLTISGSCWLPD